MAESRFTDKSLNGFNRVYSTISSHGFMPIAHPKIQNSTPVPVKVIPPDTSAPGQQRYPKKI